MQNLNPRPNWRKRLLWFATIYTASVLTFAAVAFGLEALLPR